MRGGWANSGRLGWKAISSWFFRRNPTRDPDRLVIKTCAFGVGGTAERSPRGSNAENGKESETHESEAMQRGICVLPPDGCPFRIQGGPRFSRREEAISRSRRSSRDSPRQTPRSQRLEAFIAEAKKAPIDSKTKPAPSWEHSFASIDVASKHIPRRSWTARQTRRENRFSMGTRAAKPPGVRIPTKGLASTCIRERSRAS